MLQNNNVFLFFEIHSVKLLSSLLSIDLMVYCVYNAPDMLETRKTRTRNVFLVGVLLRGLGVLPNQSKFPL